MGLAVLLSLVTVAAWVIVVTEFLRAVALCAIDLLTPAPPELPRARARWRRLGDLRWARGRRP